MKNINERNNFVFEFRPVTELFEEQVKLHPEKCAVVSGKERFTYAKLNERANRIANALVEKGVRRVIEELKLIFLTLMKIFMIKKLLFVFTRD